MLLNYKEDDIKKNIEDGKKEFQFIDLIDFNELYSSNDENTFKLEKVNKLLNAKLAECIRYNIKFHNSSVDYSEALAKNENLESIDIDEVLKEKENLEKEIDEFLSLKAAMINEVQLKLFIAKKQALIKDVFDKAKRFNPKVLEPTITKRKSDRGYDGISYILSNDLYEVHVDFYKDRSWRCSSDKLAIQKFIYIKSPAFRYKEYKIELIHLSNPLQKVDIENYNDEYFEKVLKNIKNKYFKQFKISSDDLYTLSQAFSGIEFSALKNAFKSQTDIIITEKNNHKK